MSTRSIASILLPGLLLLSVAFASNAPPANAQSRGTVTATPAAAAESYLLVGSGFTPGASITVYDNSGCGGETICPGDYWVGKATVAASGSFAVTVQLDPDQKFSAGQIHRALHVTQDDTREGPLVQVPLHHAGSAPGSPGAPATGNSSAPTGSLPFGAIILTALVLAAASASFVGLTAVRRR